MGFTTLNIGSFINSKNHSNTMTSLQEAKDNIAKAENLLRTAQADLKEAEEIPAPAKILRDDGRYSYKSFEVSQSGAVTVRLDNNHTRNTWGSPDDRAIAATTLEKIFNKGWAVIWICMIHEHEVDIQFQELSKI